MRLVRVDRPTREEIEAVRAPLSAQTRKVRFQDVDAAGTIFFPRVLEYMSDAYGELLERAGLDVPSILSEKRWAAPLAHAEADFVEPLFFGDRVVVEVALARAGRSSVTFGHRIRGADERLRCYGVTTHVFVDGTTFRPIPVPDALTAFLAASRP